MAENNHQRRLSLRAPRGVLFDRDGHAARREPRRLHHLDPPRAQRATSTRRSIGCRPSAGVDERQVRETIRRHRGEPSYRPIVGHRRCDARAGGGRAGAAPRLRAAGRRRRARAHAALPVGRPGAHLLGYVGEVSEAQMAADGLRSGVDRRAVRRREGVQRDADGRRRRAPRRGEQRRPRDHARSTKCRRPRGGASADHRLRPPAGRRGRLPRRWATTGAAVILDPRSGEVLALVSLPAYDPERFAAGIDRATWSQLNTDQLRPLQNRAIQGRYSPGSTFKVVVADGRARRGRHHARFHGALPRAARPSTAASSSASSRAGTARSTCATRSRSRATSYFYTLGNMVGVDRINKWADGARPRRAERASTCRTRSRASCRPPPGRRRGRARSGTRARRSRWRSARARCR